MSLIGTGVTSSKPITEPVPLVESIDHRILGQFLSREELKKDVEPSIETANLARKTRAMAALSEHLDYMIHHWLDDNSLGTAYGMKNSLEDSLDWSEHNWETQKARYSFIEDKFKNRDRWASYDREKFTSSTIFFDILSDADSSGVLSEVTKVIGYVSLASHDSNVFFAKVEGRIADGTLTPVRAIEEGGFYGRAYKHLTEAQQNLDSLPKHLVDDLLTWLGEWVHPLVDNSSSSYFSITAAKDSVPLSLTDDEGKLRIGNHWYDYREGALVVQLPPAPVETPKEFYRKVGQEVLERYRLNVQR